MKTSINAKLAIILLDSTNAKLKETKDSLNELAPMIKGFKAPAILDSLAACETARTKKSMEDSLTALIKSLQVETIDAVTLPEIDEDRVSLDELEQEIKIELTRAQRSFLTVGKCLHSALANIKKDGGKQVDFLAWASESCGIKKAQAYKLMGVYKNFGDESDFDGVSMRVLYTLTGQEDKVVKLARESALAGKLDTKELDRIIMSFKPVEEVEEKVTIAPNGGTVAPKGESLPCETNSPVTHIDTKAVEENVKLKAKVAKLSEAGDGATMASLQVTIEALNETVATLQAELKTAHEANVKAQAPKLPALPQFDSSCPATCLGLEVEFATDKVKVNKAYRSLASIFTAAISPESAPKILAARTALLNAIK